MTNFSASIFEMIQDVVEMVASKWLAGRIDLVETLGMLGAVTPSAAQQRRHAENGVHRRADLVAHIGQEGALGEAGGLCGVARLRQLGGARSDQFFEWCRCCANSASAALRSEISVPMPMK